MLFQTIRGIITELKPVSSIEKRWFEHILLCTLYCFTPLDSENDKGKELQETQLKLSRNLLLQHIDFFAPTHVLFTTGWEHGFEKFANLFPFVHRINSSDDVVGVGMYGRAKIVVIADRGRQGVSDNVVKAFREI